MANDANVWSAGQMYDSFTNSIHSLLQLWLLTRENLAFGWISRRWTDWQELPDTHVGIVNYVIMGIQFILCTLQATLICLIDEVKELVMMLPEFLVKFTKSFGHVLRKVKGRGFSCFAF